MRFARTTLCKEVVHELGATHAGVRVEEGKKGGDEGNDSHLGFRVISEPFSVANML